MLVLSAMAIVNATRMTNFYVLPDNAFSHEPTAASQWTPSIDTVFAIIFGVSNAVLGIWSILLIRRKAVEGIGM